MRLRSIAADGTGDHGACDVMSAVVSNSEVAAPPRLEGVVEEAGRSGRDCRPGHAAAAVPGRHMALAGRRRGAPARRRAAAAVTGFTPSGTGGSCTARSTSGTAASSSSRARTSTASGLRASSTASASAPSADRVSRGARKALLQLVREARAPPTAFSVDGPRGPAKVAQPGAVWLSKATGNPVVPFHLEAARHWSLRSWDRTQIPKPFTTIALVIRRAVHRAPRGRRERRSSSIVSGLERELGAAEHRCHELAADHR